MSSQLPSTRAHTFVCNLATRCTASSGMQTGCQVPRRPGLIRCSFHYNTKNCSFVLGTVNTDFIVDVLLDW